MKGVGVLALFLVIAGCSTGRTAADGRPKPAAEPSESPAVGAEEGRTPDARGSVRSGAYVLVPAFDRLAKPKDGVERPEPLKDLEHGGTYWAVYLAAVDAGPSAEDPQEEFRLLADAAARLNVNFRREYFAPGSGGNCDMGAVQALKSAGLASPSSYLGLYFSTAEDADRFAGALDPPSLVTSEVRTFCLD